jgi:hypothetical protein
MRILAEGWLRAVAKSAGAVAVSLGLKRLEVHLTPDQEAFIRQAIESGRLQRKEDGVQQAMLLWEQRAHARGNPCRRRRG